MTTTATEKVAKTALSMEDILQETSLPPDTDYIELSTGTMVKIASLDAGDLIEWNEAGEGEAKRTAGLRLIVKSLINEEGVRYARANEARSLQQLKRLKHIDADKIAEAVLKLNGLNRRDKEAAKNA